MNACSAADKHQLLEKLHNVRATGRCDRGRAESRGAAAEGYIRLYRFKDNGKQLELIHRTPTGGIPGALTGLKGKLLAGVGSTLRVYEAGKKKLLRKCEHRKLPTHIMTLATSGDRIYVGDQQVSTCSQSMHAQHLSMRPCLGFNLTEDGSSFV